MKRPGRKFCAIGLAAAFLLSFAVLVVQFASQPQPRLLASHAPHKFTSQISHQFAPDLSACAEAEMLNRHERAIISALFTLESYAASWPERLSERVLAFGASWLGIAPPDLSYGPGQIRLSRAATVHTETQSGQLARQLLSTCGSLPIAQSILRAVAPKITTTDVTELSSKDIRLIARTYNGATRLHAPHAALSSAIYQQLTYDLVMRSYFNQPR